MSVYRLTICAVTLALEVTTLSAEESAVQGAITDGPSIQRTLDVRPGQVLYVPPGDYEILQASRITHDRSGLAGSGRIIQTNPNAANVVATDAAGLQIRDLHDSAAGPDGMHAALVADSCRNRVIDNVQVIDNRAPRQLSGNPPLADIVISGNVVYDPRRDGMLVDGKPTVVPPRYRYALVTSSGSEMIPGPIRVRVRQQYTPSWHQWGRQRFARIGFGQNLDEGLNRHESNH